MEEDKKSLESIFNKFKNNPQFAHFGRSEKAEFLQAIQPQKQEAERMVQIIGKRRFGNMLDIGCSAGGLSLAFSDYAGKVYGIDPEREAVELSRAIVAYFGNKNVDLTVAANESLPFEDSFFDLVVSKTVIEHVADVEKSIKEMKRVLSQGGEIYLEAPNYFWFFESHYKLPFFPFMPRFLFKLMCRVLSKDTEFIDHINFINPWQIEKAFREEGLLYENVYLKKLRSILVDGEAPKSTFYGWLSPLVKFMAFTRIGYVVYVIMAKTGVYPTMAYVARKKNNQI